MLNGRLDLSQVEGLADLIDAETEEQRKQAKRLLDGALSDKVKQWREQLIEARSLLEATIDFADEDVPVDVSESVLTLIETVSLDLARELKGYGASERTRSGFEVAIVGPPNVGKSTLLNALAGREAAITSNIAGTTRDVIEVRMDIAGFAVTLLDTAGIRETVDEIEAIGVARARSRADAADLRIFLEEEETQEVSVQKKCGDLWRRAKADVLGYPEGSISGTDGFGIDDLVEEIRDVLLDRMAGGGLIVNLRQRNAIAGGLEHLKKAKDFLEDGPEGYDLASEEIRIATWKLRELVGEVDIDAVYEGIFQRFCIGK